MAFNILEEVRKKSREGWQDLVQEKWSALRVWVQENGEQSAILSLLIGFFMAYFFKAFVALLAFAVIIAFSIYLLAYPDSEMPQQHSSDSTSDNMASSSDKALSNDKDPEITAESIDQDDTPPQVH